jgi:Ca2+/Na+ antiporter
MDLTALLLAGVAFVASIWLMVEGAEKLTESFLRLSITFGASTFVLGYILSGIDLENLAVGIAGATAQMPSVALGTVIGSGTFLLTFAVGATAILSPLRTDTPRRLIVLTLLSPVPFALLARHDASAGSRNAFPLARPDSESGGCRASWAVCRIRRLGNLRGPVAVVWLR